MNRLKGHNRNWTEWLPWGAILIIGCAYALMSFYMPLTGDDLSFAAIYHNLEATWKGIPIVLRRHWLEMNNRMGDMLTVILFGTASLPVWALLNGAGSAGFFIAAMKAWSGKGQTALRMIFISLLSFTLPWATLWMEFCTQVNCVWAAACGITAVIIAFYGNPRASAAWRWLMLPFCLIAGWMHEAQGVPLACGVIFYLLLSPFRKEASTVRILSAIAIITGGLMHLLSPVIYARSAQPLIEPWWRIIALSAFWVIVLIILTVWTAWKRKDVFTGLIRSPWSIFFASALAGVPVMLAAGFSGRPGWFAEVNALIAIFLMADRLGWRLHGKFSTLVSVTLFLCLAFHYVEVARWQRQLGLETRQFISRLHASPDGVIYLDYTPDSDLPWWLLRKVHGVPDADDDGYLMASAKAYSGGKPIVVLPEKAREIDFPSFRGTRFVGRFILSDRRLPGVADRRILKNFKRMVCTYQATDYIENSFMREGREFYLYTPIDPDPGETSNEGNQGVESNTTI